MSRQTQRPQSAGTGTRRQTAHCSGRPIRLPLPFDPKPSVRACGLRHGNAVAGTHRRTSPCIHSSAYTPPSVTDNSTCSSANSLVGGSLHVDSANPDCSSSCRPPSHSEGPAARQLRTTFLSEPRPTQPLPLRLEGSVPPRAPWAVTLASAISITAAGASGPLDAATAAALWLPPLPAAAATLTSPSQPATATTTPVVAVAAPPLTAAAATPLAAVVPGSTDASVGSGTLPGGAPGVLSASPQPAPPPALRFTGPEELEALPPLPSEFPPLPELRLPNYTTATLPNGLRVFLLEDREVPLVRVTLLMLGGQYGSPPDKVGLASLAAAVQRGGGSTSHPAPSLDSRLEQLAAAIELGAGPQAVSADVSCLAEDAEEVLGLLAEVVRSPVLPADKLSLYQAKLLNALDHQDDSPAATAHRKAAKLLYGPNSIYAHTPTKAGVAAITTEDLRVYVDTWERPDGSVLGVVGAFEPREMMRIVEREFGVWAPAEGQPAEPPKVPKGPPPALPPLVVEAAAVAASGGATAAAASGGDSASPSRLARDVTSPPSVVSLPSPASAASSSPPRRPVVYLVNRPGLTQAYLVTSEPGISLSSPDLYALDVLGAEFNSFGGQLFDTLRSREGLAYSVSGGWDSPPDHPGLFVAGGQTSSPGEFLTSLRRLLATAASQPPSTSDLAAAKAETLNSFAFNFASSAAQLQRILVYDLLGLPQDFLFQYFRGIEAVDEGDVQRAAAAHLHPERQAVVVVADRELAQPSLEAAGFQVVAMRVDDGDALL